jgi:hypothetical protein
MRERFDAGTGLVAVGAVLLLVSLFVDWYRPGGDAWAVFEWVDLALAGAAVCALLALLPRYDGVARALPVICLAALATVAVNVIDLPPAARGADRATGAWLALAATGVMAAGAVLAAASISVTVDVRGRERRRRTAAIDAREGATEAAAPETAEPQPSADTPRRRSARREGSLLDPRSAPPADDPDRTQAIDPIDPPRQP